MFLVEIIILIINIILKKVLNRSLMLSIFIVDNPFEDFIREERRVGINQERLEQENRIFIYCIKTLYQEGRRKQKG